MTLPPTYSAVGKYQRLAKLGEGNFGEAYKVVDRALGVTRALKILKPTNPPDLASQLREARILITCSHTHIVSVKEADIFMVDGVQRVCIAYELLPNGSVEASMATQFLNPCESIAFIKQALFGLEYLHIKGILHKDIKPGNLLLDSTNNIKIADFGLAASISAPQNGTPAYMPHVSPEVISGSVFSTQSDIYAMGVTFYRLLNNWNSFGRDIPQNIHAVIQAGKFPNRKQYASHVPHCIKRICNKAMEVDVSRRFKSASEFRQALERVDLQIKWKRISNMEWVAQSKTIKFRILAQPRKHNWEVLFSKNNRNIRKYCHSVFENQDKACQYMNEIVAETSCAAP